MNFFASIFGEKTNSNKPQREDDSKVSVPTIFLTEEQHEEKKSKLISVASTSIPFILEHGYSEGDLVRLEYFFVTNSDEQAHRLADELFTFDYDYEVGILEDSDLFMITGKTTPIEISSKSLSDWASSMCDLGFKFDCLLDRFEIPEIDPS